jgi:hypothetical protein
MKCGYLWLKGSHTINTIELKPEGSGMHSRFFGADDG